MNQDQSLIVETRLEKFQSDLWGRHFPIPLEIAEQLIEGKNRRVICSINNLHTMQAALMPDKGNWFILINKPLCKKLALALGEKVTLTLSKDRSDYGMEMPEELQELLAQDAEFEKHFEKLTKGKQRSLIYIVAKVKSTQSRINKALAIAEHLKDFAGEIDYKALNETIKLYNQRSKF